MKEMELLRTVAAELDVPAMSHELEVPSANSVVLKVTPFAILVVLFVVGVTELLARPIVEIMY